jgi:hypothetical protein
MTDLKSPTAIYVKGILFLVTGFIAAGLLIAEAPSLRVVALFAIAIWCFCRAYYFAFYVVEHYVDPGYKFTGLGSFVLYLLRGQRPAKSAELDSIKPGGRSSC